MSARYTRSGARKATTSQRRLHPGRARSAVPAGEQAGPDNPRRAARGRFAGLPVPMLRSSTPGNPDVAARRSRAQLATFASRHGAGLPASRRRHGDDRSRTASSSSGCYGRPSLSNASPPDAVAVRQRADRLRARLRRRERARMSAVRAAARVAQIPRAWAPLLRSPPAGSKTVIAATGSALCLGGVGLAFLAQRLLTSAGAVDQGRILFGVASLVALGGIVLIDRVAPLSVPAAPKPRLEAWRLGSRRGMAAAAPSHGRLRRLARNHPADRAKRRRPMPRSSSGSLRSRSSSPGRRSARGTRSA